MGLNPSTRIGSLFLLFSSFLFGAAQLRLGQTVVGPIGVNAGAATSAIVEAANVGDGSLNLQLTSSAPWIAATTGGLRNCTLQVNACTPIQITIRSSTLARGLHTGVLTVADPNALDAPQTIMVSVNVGGNVPERATFYVAPNGQSQNLNWNAAGPLNATATTQSGGNWLAVGAALAGSVQAGVIVPYRITANPAGLGEGTYEGQVTVAGSNITQENRSVPVTLRVTTQPIAQLSSERLAFRIAQGSAKQTQAVVVSNRGQGTLTLSSASAATASGGNWLTATQQNNVVQVTADPANIAPGSYQGTLTVGSNAVQGNVTVPVQLDVVAAGSPLAYANGVVNNATFEGGDVLAQGAIVALFGEQFTTAEASVASALPLTNELGGTRVLINDQPAPVYYVSYNQINFQVPYNAPTGDVVIRVERGGQRGNPISARIVNGAARLLRLGIGDYAIAVNQDQSFPIPTTPGISSRPARRGETLVFYAIGLGPTVPVTTSGAASPSSPLAVAPGNWRVVFGQTGPFAVGSVETTPMFAGLTPGFVGLYQVNVTIPADAPIGDAVPVTLAGDTGLSNRVTIAIQ